MSEQLGRSVEAALSSLPAGQDAPRLVVTAAPVRNGQARQDGRLRLVACRQGVWIAARFHDGPPAKKEET